MSTVALTIGLVVGNIIKPGEGLHIDEATKSAGQAAAAEGHGSTTEFLLGIIPDSLFSSLTSGEVLQTLLVALLIGFAVQRMGAAGKPILEVIEVLQRLVFRVLAMIMWAAPDRCLRRHGRRRRRDRLRRAEEPGAADGGVLPDLRAVRLRGARDGAQAGRRASTSSRCSATSPASSC